MCSLLNVSGSFHQRSIACTELTTLQSIPLTFIYPVSISQAQQRNVSLEVAYFTPLMSQLTVLRAKTEMKRLIEKYPNGIDDLDAQ